MPVKHPDPFRYSADGLEASVNPYVALLREASVNGDLPLAFGAQLQAFPGAWRERVAAHYGRNTSQPVYKRLVVEIGCHLGQTLLAMAAAHPDTLFIGIDITFKRVVTTAQRAKARGLSNVFGVLANARAIGQMFRPGEVDGLVVFFPDPWVKKARQAKNRLVDAEFCQSVAHVLSPGGFCWFKTDQAPYFAEAAAAMQGAGLTPLAAAEGLLAETYTSTFERRFSMQSVPTHAAKWLKEDGERGLFA